jgi:histidine triad (HIT) family protein
VGLFKILDVRGHVLLLPKRHKAIMPQMDDLEIGHIFTVAKHISGALLKSLKAEGTNIFVANGSLAGQKAPHFMVHVIPRREGDGLNLVLPQNQIPSADLSRVREMLMPKLKEHFQMSEIDVENLLKHVETTQEKSEHSLKEIPKEKEQPKEHIQAAPKIPQVDEPVDLDAISNLVNKPVKKMEKAVEDIEIPKPEELEKPKEKKEKNRKGKISLGDINNLFENG